MAGAYGFGIIEGSGYDTLFDVYMALDYFIYVGRALRAR